MALLYGALEILAHGFLDWNRPTAIINNPWPLSIAIQIPCTPDFRNRVQLA
ncbi:Hypothetical predicted protein [Pelobates cultripes]|uniref:Uncharacterized protein n=1 Tax=Pelobates cultripes TaxID=61616 RepID=A0AAD1WY86_PELCU|nr:Hypothetical predicted protein [Pelobates cultripes]